MSHPGVEPCRFKVPLGFCRVLFAPLTPVLSLQINGRPDSSQDLELFKEPRTCVVESINTCASVCKIIYKENKPVNHLTSFCGHSSHDPGFRKLNKTIKL